MGRGMKKPYRKQLFATGIASLLSMGWVSTLYAQAAADDRATAFKAVRGVPKESIAGGTLLLIAYALLWLLLLAFVLYTALLMRCAARELQTLRQELKALPEASSQQS